MAATKLALRPGQIRRIEKLAKAGWPRIEIAKAVGCKPNTVARRCAAHGWPLIREGTGRNNGTWTPERVTALKQMWADGESASAIARHLGVTKNAVISKVRGLELSPRRGRRNANPGGFNGRPRLKPKPLPMPEPKAPADAPEPLNVSCLEVRDHQCKYATHSRGMRHLFCGHAVSKPGSSWCPAHERLVWNKGA